MLKIQLRYIRSLIAVSPKLHSKTLQDGRKRQDFHRKMIQNENALNTIVLANLKDLHARCRISIVKCDGGTYCKDIQTDIN